MIENNIYITYCCTEKTQMGLYIHFLDNSHWCDGKIKMLKTTVSTKKESLTL